MFFTALACILAAVLCLIGTTMTRSELSSQNLWFVYTVAALLVPTLFLWVLNRHRCHLGVVDLAAGMFLVWYSFCFYINGSVALPILMELCFLAAAYVALRILFSSCPNSLKWVFVIICVCGIVEAIIGIKQAFGVERSNHGLFQVTGTFFNPGPYGGYLATIFSMALGYVVMRYGYCSKIFLSFKSLRTLTLRNILWTLIFITALAAVILILIILPSTMSRAAFVAVAVAAIAVFGNRGGIFSSIYAYFRKNKMKCAILATTVLVLVCCGGYYIYSLKKDSADGRLLIWKISAKVMLANPVKGVGPGYFRGAYGDMQAEYFKTGERSGTEIKVAGTPEYGFNEYLKIGAETGITGLVIFLFFVLAALSRLLRSNSFYAYGLIALLVFAFFSYPFSILPMKILLIVFFAAAGSFRRRAWKANKMDTLVTGAVLLGCVAAVVFLYKPYAARVAATGEWKELQRWYKMEYYKYVLEDAPGLFPHLNDNPAFLFEYGRSLNMEGQYEESLPILRLASRLSGDPMIHNVIGNNYRSLGRYDKAAGAYLKAHYTIPNRMYSVYLLAKLYSESGDMENARAYAEQVIGMAPKIESSATRDMQKEMKELVGEITEKKEEVHN